MRCENRTPFAVERESILRIYNPALEVQVTAQRFASKDLERLAIQVINAVLDVEAGQTNEQTGALPASPSGRCSKYLLLKERSYCGRELLKGSQYCYWHTQGVSKYQPTSVQDYFGEGSTLPSALAKEVAEGRSLESAYLVDAPLGGSLVGPGCNLRGGQFQRANFSGAHLSYSDLEGANFSYANLESARLSDCRIRGAIFNGTRLFGAKFRNNDFAGVVGLTMENFRGLKWRWLPFCRMLEEYPQQCERMYRKLAVYFSSEGLFDDASWAAYRACLMRHRILLQHLSSSRMWATSLVDSALYEKPLEVSCTQFRRTGLPWFFASLAWCRSSLLRFLMGYGEKPLRVVANAICTILMYATLYYLRGGFTDKTFLGSLYFSVVTFTTLGYGDLVPHGAMRLVAASEALLGILLSGLFIFCLARRSVGRA